MTETEYLGNLDYKIISSRLIPGGGRHDTLALRTPRGRKQYTRNAMKTNPHLFTVEALHRAGLTKRGKPMLRQKCGRCYECKPRESLAIGGLLH